MTQKAARELAPIELVKLGICPIQKHFVQQAAERIYVPAVASQVSNTDNEVKKKSKKQIKRERKKETAETMCIKFLTGSCEHGDNCKRSHDKEEYLKNKVQDLPGKCPQTNSSEPCTYGITCRWAGSHQDLPDEVRTILQNHRNDIGNNSNQSETIELPLLDNIQVPINLLDKEVQRQLQRNQYDFSKSKEILQEMGLHNKRKRPENQEQVTASTSADQEEPVYMETPLKSEEIKIFDFRNKLYLAPLTTVGNLPFRYVCKTLGADVTCGEMALATNLLQGSNSEWALLKRHPIEDMFGVQICGGYEDSMSRCAQLLDENIDVDFVDINMGCPIDIICNRGAGSALLRRQGRMRNIIQVVGRTLSCPVTFKIRKGYNEDEDLAHKFLPQASSWGACAVTLHGRTRQQRYSKLADWQYIRKCADVCQDTELQLIGNGDVFSFTDHYDCMELGKVSTCMLARGALIKPWLFTEIKERRHWDISAGERLDILKQFCSVGLLHWGSDARGVDVTRRFLLEWLSYLHRYVPVGLLEVVPQKLHWRPPRYNGRNELETLFASDNAKDWVKISEMLLGPAPPNFSFSPKHKSNAYSTVQDLAYDANLSNG